MNIIQRSAYRLLKQGVFAGPLYVNANKQCCAIGVLLDDPEGMGGILGLPTGDSLTKVQRELYRSQPGLTDQDWPLLVALQRANDVIEAGELVTVMRLAEAALLLAGVSVSGQKELIQVAELLLAMQCPFYYTVDGMTANFFARHDAVFGNWHIHTHRTLRMSAERVIETLRGLNLQSEYKLKEIEA